MHGMMGDGHCQRKGKANWEDSWAWTTCFSLLSFFHWVRAGVYNILQNQFSLDVIVGVGGVANPSADLKRRNYKDSNMG